MLTEKAPHHRRIRHFLGPGTGIVAVDKSSALSRNQSLIPHAFSLQFFLHTYMFVFWNQYGITVPD